MKKLTKEQKAKYISKKEALAIALFPLIVIGLLSLGLYHYIDVTSPNYKAGYEAGYYDSRVCMNVSVFSPICQITSLIPQDMLDSFSVSNMSFNSTQRRSFVKMHDAIVILSNDTSWRNK